MTMSVLVAFGGASPTLSACSVEDEGELGNGRLEIQLGSSPRAIYNGNPPRDAGELEALSITIARVDVTFLDDRPIETIRTDPVTIDLLATEALFHVIADGELPVGDVAQIRLVIADASAVVAGEDMEVKVPSGPQTGLKLPIHRTISERTTTTIFLNFDAERSVKVQSNGRVMLHPVVTEVDIGVTEKLGASPCTDDDHWPESEFPIPYLVNVTSLDAIGLPDSLNYVRGAADKWRSESGTVVDLDFAGVTTLGASNPVCFEGADATDGNNVIVGIAGSHEGGTGVAAGVCVILDDVTREIIEADIRIFAENADRSWTYDEVRNGTVVDIFQTVEHEFGHVLGLCHPAAADPITGTIIPKAVMHPSSLDPRQLQVFDINSLGFRGYTQRTAAPIGALFSDDGLNWTAPPNFESPGDTTFGLGAASGPDSDDIVLVFLGGPGNLFATKGDGVTWSTPVEISGAGVIGPTVTLAFGDGPNIPPSFVVTFTEFVLEEDRRVMRRVSSTDGLTWSGASTLDPGGGLEQDLPCAIAYSLEEELFACMLVNHSATPLGAQSSFTSFDGDDWAPADGFFNFFMQSHETAGLACSGTVGGRGYCLFAASDNRDGTRYRFTATGAVFSDEPGFGTVLTVPVRNDFKLSQNDETTQRVSLTVRPSEDRFVAVWRGLEDDTSGRDIRSAITIAPGLDGGTWTGGNAIAISEIPPAVTYNPATDTFWMFFADGSTSP